MPLDPAPEPLEVVRLLITAVANDEVFTDRQIGIFLDLEGQVVKLAAARALSVIATDEALLSKVIKDGELSTDGAKLAAELRAQAKELRDSHAAGLDAEDEGYFSLVDNQPCAAPELTSPRYWS